MYRLPASQSSSLLRTAAALVLATACAGAMAKNWSAVALDPAVDGSGPGGQLLAEAGGSLVGTARGGGASNAGTVFRIDAQGNVSVLHTFDDSDGYAPIAGLAVGPDGAYYGVTSLGAANGLGGVFRITPAGDFTLLHSFDYVNDHGANGARSALTLGPDGNFYGTTPSSSGYPNHAGTVFRVTPAGDVTTLQVFPAKYRYPQAGVIFGQDGRLYGTTSSDGRKDCGVLYSIATDGSGFRLEHRFDHHKDGCHPLTTMVAAANGTMYGTTQYGGPKGGEGVMFSYAPTTGKLSVLHVFHDDDPMGNDPSAGVTLGQDGTLYGATAFGSTNGNGAIWSFSTQGAFTLLHAPAGDGSEGMLPQTAPVFSGASMLAGGLLQGGANSGGTVYRVQLAK
jgi:uncharacterized repeat protein (TIGR03803 family)